jgi:hypothetical protein
MDNSRQFSREHKIKIAQMKLEMAERLMADALVRVALGNCSRGEFGWVYNNLLQAEDTLALAQEIN